MQHSLPVPDNVIGRSELDKQVVSLYQGYNFTRQLNTPWLHDRSIPYENSQWIKK